MFCLLLVGVLLPLEVFAIGSPYNKLFNREIFYFDPGQEGDSERCALGTGGFSIRAPQINDKEALAAAIDKYIRSRQPSSPFKNLGKYFVEGGVRADINPIFGVAVAAKETSLGTSKTATGVIYDHNAFGRTANPATQPFINPSGRAWYKWESWETSVYSKKFPADGTVSQPDDFFQYVARVYGVNLDNGLESFLVGGNGAPGYAPPSENDVKLYIETVEKIATDIAKLAGNSIDLAARSSVRGGCGVSGDVISYALLYAWPQYHEPPYINAKPEYTDAILQAQRKGEYVGGGQYPGIDCGGFVTRVMRDSDYDPDYNSANCNTECQHTYLEANWRKINVTSTADLQPGDVAWREGHTFMYVGNQPGFETTVASASFSTTGESWRAPMSGVESVLDSALTWYRLR